MYCKEQLVCEAYSEHCFLNKDGLPIRIKKEYPEFYEALTNGN
jgi:acyl-CoA thioester hydrolase